MVSSLEHLRSCWEIYLEHRRRLGRSDLSGGLRALRRQLRESYNREGYVRELDRIVVMNGRRLRTIGIDLNHAGQFLDVDIFPEGNVRSWGGSRDTTEPWGD